MKKQTTVEFLIVAMAIAVVFTVSFQIKAQESRLTTPDFSEMEKYYEIVKWTYSDDGNIKMIIKPKAEPPQIHHLFTMRFFDEDGIDMQYKYNICCPGYNSPAGEVERVETPAPEESKLSKVKSIIVYRILDDGTLVGPKVEAAKKDAASNNSPAAKDQPQNKSNNEAVTNVSSDGNCNYDAQPALGVVGRFSQVIAKSALYARYSFEKDTGGLSSPLAVGVTFLNVHLLGSYTNTVTVVPGREAQRKHDGAPVGATIYRFHAKYIVCRKYKNATRRTQYESDNVCFKDKNGGWNCPVDSVPKITELE